MHPAQQERAERLQKDFDIEPEEGVVLDPLKNLDQKPEDGADQELQAEPPDLEDVETQAREKEDDEEQGGDELPRMSSFDFAEATGVTPQEIFEKIEFRTQRGLKTGKELVDDYESLLERESQWEQDRQQLQDQAQTATQQAISQPQSQEAQKLWMQADFLEQQYGQIKWDQIDPGERADLKIEYDRQIQGLRRQAQVKQQEYDVELDGKRRAFQVEAHRQTLKLVPEWNSREVFDTETSAITNMLRTVYQMPDRQIAMLPSDPISMKIVRDLWDATRKNAENSKGAEKIRKFSKSVSPSSRRTAKQNDLATVGERVRSVSGGKAARQEARLKAQFER